MIFLINQVKSKYFQESIYSTAIMYMYIMCVCLDDKTEVKKWWGYFIVLLMYNYTISLFFTFREVRNLLEF